jgi:hypothetical protein
MPLAEVSIVSESRKMIAHTNLLKSSRENLETIHVALFTDCLLFCGIRQNPDEAVRHSFAESVTLMGTVAVDHSPHGTFHARRRI